MLPNLTTLASGAAIAASKNHLCVMYASVAEYVCDPVHSSVCKYVHTVMFYCTFNKAINFNRYKNTMPYPLCIQATLSVMWCNVH